MREEMPVLPVKLLVVEPLEPEVIALCQRLLGAHGGSVELQRDHDGNGVCTLITCPERSTRVIQGGSEYAAEVTFPDGYHLRELLRKGRRTTVAFPAADIPDAFRARVATFVPEDAPPPVGIHVLITSPLPDAAVAVVTDLMETHAGSLIVDTAGPGEGTSQQGACAIYLFPAGCRIHTGPRCGTRISEIVFPDGFRVQVSTQGRTVTVHFPQGAIPDAYRQLIPTYAERQSNDV